MDKNDSDKQPEAKQEGAAAVESGHQDVESPVQGKRLLVPEVCD
jgi:hypothetical protein